MSQNVYIRWSTDYTDWIYEATNLMTRLFSFSVIDLRESAIWDNQELTFSTESWSFSAIFVFLNKKREEIDLEYLFWSKFSYVFPDQIEFQNDITVSNLLMMTEKELLDTQWVSKFPKFIDMTVPKSETFRLWMISHNFWLTFWYVLMLTIYNKFLKAGDNSWELIDKLNQDIFSNDFQSLVLSSAKEVYHSWDWLTWV